MTARPILFSGGMVKAIDDGRKSQTRRVLKPQPIPTDRTSSGRQLFWWKDRQTQRGLDEIADFCPYGTAGDILWVRTSWWRFTTSKRNPKSLQAYIPSAQMLVWPDGSRIESANLSPEDHPKHWKRKPSIHMPRWASPFDLQIMRVRVERVQDITEEDARAEGVEPQTHLGPCRPYRCAVSVFSELWDSINGKRPGCSWEDNPLVFAISFARAS